MDVDDVERKKDIEAYYEVFAGLYSEKNVKKIKGLQIGNKFVVKIEFPYCDHTLTYERLSQEETKKNLKQIILDIRVKDP